MDKKRERSSSFKGGDDPQKTRKVDTTSPPNLDFLSFKPNFTTQKIEGIGEPQRPNFLTGKAFTDSIALLRSGKDPTVSTSFQLKVKPSDGKVRPVTVQGSISVMEQSTGLVQGNLKTPSNTTYLGSTQKGRYNKVVFPENLSLQRATLEARAIKALSPIEGGYDPGAKVSDLKEIPMNKNKSFPAKNTLGMFALGSHLEDVTANRALSLQDVGSGMRAMVMSTKWKMELQRSEEPGKGFQQRMFQMFPQLGRQDVKRLDKEDEVEMEKTGISGLSEHWKESRQVFSKKDQVENIKQLHLDAQNTAHDVFGHKLSQLSRSQKPKGQWWADNAERLQKFLPDLGSKEESQRQSAQQEVKKIGLEYVQRKMDRHGIRRN